MRQKQTLDAKGKFVEKKILVWNISPGDLNSIQIKWARRSWPLCISPVEELYKKNQNISQLKGKIHGFYFYLIIVNTLTNHIL